MGLVLVTAPAAEPVSLAEAKLHLRIDATDEDALITELIAAARKYCERFTRRAWITQTWDLKLPRFPPVDDPWELGFCDRAIRLPLPPAQSTTSITYTDENGISQTLSSSLYTLDSTVEPALIHEAYNEDWPETRDVPNAVVVRFVAGYGLAASVPEPLKIALKLLVAHWFEHREAAQDTALHSVPMAVESLLLNYRCGGYP